MKIFLCDDEEEALEFYEEELKELATKHSCSLEILKFTNGHEMLFYIDDQWDEIDAIYLDINMPDIDGIAIAEELRNSGFNGEIIFLTVSKEHFLPAFDVRAFNYIVKGESPSERFESIFLEIVRLVNEKEKEFILLSGGGEHRRIEIDDIHYFEIDKRIVTVHYKDQEFEFSSTLGKLENRLYNKGFVRVHRAFLVADNAIQDLDHKTLRLRNGDVIPVGRTYQKEVQDFLKEDEYDEESN